jgi:hypothetical protein
MKKLTLLALASLAASLLQAAEPFTVEQLQLRVRVRPNYNLGLTANSMYNPRFFNGDIYAVQINTYCFARYPSGSSIPSLAVAETTAQTRMVAPFPGALSTTYLLASGGTLSPFIRYNFDGNNPVEAAFPDGEKVESFDWVGNNTIICTDYTNKRRLYLVNVTAQPFALAKNTSWPGGLGYITSAASTRIRNVRVGQTYSNYAYYGDNGVAANPKVYALNLTTGVETEVGHWDGTLLAYTDGSAGSARTGSWGLWTVVERGGYLYLQSSDNGIQVFRMSGPTTLAEKVRTYELQDLNNVTHDGDRAIYGFDVAPDGQGLLLGSFTGNVYELGQPTLTVSAISQTGMTLSWPASVTNVVLQSSPDLSPGSFSDIAPTTSEGSDVRSATVDFGAGRSFFRLRKSW